jgi:3-oxoacyl-[acyl-carrier protein] reductase
VIDLSGWQVVVTGGSRGIGAACSRLFAQAGAAVVVHYRTAESAASSLVAELHRLSPGPHRSVRADLGIPEQVPTLFSEVGKHWDRVDCLVNNAGVWVENPIETLDADGLASTFSQNLSSVFLCVKEALPLLRASDQASIVNIGSTAGQRGEARYSPYAASKGALVAATKSWAIELAPRIRVNVVSPGWVETEMTAAALEGRGTEIAAGIPLGRVAAPRDIAGPVVFLASPLARHMTGSVVSVNGGSVLAG